MTNGLERPLTNPALASYHETQVRSSELTLDFMQSGWGTSPETPRQPDRDHLSRPPGANSRPGKYGGHEIRDAQFYSSTPEPLFPFPGERGFWLFRADSRIE